MSLRTRSIARCPTLGALALLIAIAGFTTAARPAGATVSAWHPTGSSVPSDTDPSISRRPNGTMDIAYPAKNGASWNIKHKVLTTAGTVSSAQWVLPANWNSLTQAKLYRDGSTLRVVFGGIRTIVTGDPYAGYGFYSATFNGTSWSLDPGPMSHYGGGYTYVSSPAVSTGVPGGPLVSWGHNSTVYSHLGATNFTALSTPNAEYDAPGNCCVYGTNLVRDRVSGAVNQVWYASNTGVWTRRVYPTLGSPINAPHGTTTGYAAHRIPTAGREGGGRYASYCTGPNACNAVRLWKIGATTDLKIADLPSGGSLWPATALAAGPEGRMWIAWQVAGGYIKVAVTNRAATAVSRVWTLTNPGHGYASRIQLAGRGNSVDVLATIGAGSTYNVHHRQITL